MLLSGLYRVRILKVSVDQNVSVFQLVVAPAQNLFDRLEPAARGCLSSCFRWSDAMPAKPKTGGYASGQVQDDDESDDSDEGQSRVDAGTGPDAETQPQIRRASTASDAKIDL